MMQGGTPFLTSEISRLASKFGLEIESVVPQPDLPVGPYLRSQIRVIANATFFDLLDFLRSLEKSEPLFKVDLLEIGTPTAGGPGRGAEKEAIPSLHFLENPRQRISMLISGFSRKGAYGP